MKEFRIAPENYGGQLVRERGNPDPMHNPWVRFPDILSAAQWVSANELTDKAVIECIHTNMLPFRKTNLIVRVQE